MKHEKKEWYTCDRCGKSIDEIPSNVIEKIFTRMEFGNFIDIKMLTATKSGYVSDVKLIAPDVYSAEICEYYNGKRKHIHLCGKCRKAFEEFMKNKMEVCK